MMPSCPLFDMNSAVINLIFFDNVITNATLLANMMSSNRVMFMYLYYIYGGIPTCVTIASGENLLVVSPFIDPIFGPNIYSPAMMSYIITGKSGSWLTFIILS